MLHARPETKTAESPNGADAFMHEAYYLEYNEQGLLKSSLYSPFVRHFNNKDETVYFSKPRATVFTAKRVPWHVKARYGKSIHSGKVVYLWDHVNMHQPQQPMQPETTITTSAMTIFPHRSLAKTNRKATIKRPESTVSGIGATANLKTGIIQLLSHSQGVYDAKQHS